VNIPGNIDGIIWFAFAASVCFSFMLSGMEAGVFALSRLRIRQQMRAGRPAARALYQYLENPENFLWTILVGNTVANLFITGWVFVILHRAVGNRLGLFLAVYLLVVFVFHIGLDLLPKTLFRLYPNRLCMMLVRPFRVVHLFLRPLVAIVTAASALLANWTGGRAFTGSLFGNREELRLLMQESAQTLTSDEQAMINRVLDFQSITVR
jgi:CBS domain containing-hemolysin-like protein